MEGLHFQRGFRHRKIDSLALRRWRSRKTIATDPVWCSGFVLTGRASGRYMETSPIVRASLHKLLILCCALYLSGAHWVVLQTTAWTGMLVSRSIATSVSDAIETTFDGKHPCPLCAVISDGKQAEQQSEQSFDLLKKVGDLKFLGLPVVELVHGVVASNVVWPASAFTVLTRSEAPPTPPPLA